MNTVLRKNRVSLKLSIRALMISVACIAVLIAWYVHNSQKAHRQRTAIQEIQSLGGTTISMLYDGDLIRPYCSGQNNLPWKHRNWRTRIFGIELSDDVHVVDLNASGITESEIRDMIPWIKQLRTPAKAYSANYITLNMWSNPNVSRKLARDLETELPDIRKVLTDPYPVGAKNTPGGK